MKKRPQLFVGCIALTLIINGFGWIRTNLKTMMMVWQAYLGQ
jgi:hypothetical protein